MIIELDSGNAGLYFGIHIIRIDGQDVIHLTGINGYATLCRNNMAFKRGANTIGNNGALMLVAYADNGRYFIRISGKGNSIRRM